MKRAGGKRQVRAEEGSDKGRKGADRIRGAVLNSSGKASKQNSSRQDKSGKNSPKQNSSRQYRDGGGSGKYRKAASGALRREQYATPLPIKDLRVSVEREEQLKAVLKCPGISLIYLDEACFSNEELRAYIKEIKGCGIRAGIRLRRIERSDELPSSEELMRELIKSVSPDAVLIRCLESLMQIKRLRDELEASAFPELCFDYTLYGYNSAAVQALLMLGADRMTFPIELNRKELSSLRDKISCPAELLVYAHLPMMVSANCIEKTSRGCDRGNKTEGLKDRMGVEMPVRMYCKYCYNQVFNAHPLSLLDLEKELLSLRPESIRYDFSIEDAETCRKILEGRLPDNITRGHFHSGVE